MNKYTKELIEFLKEKSNQGQNTILIPLQKKRKEFDSFMIHPIYKKLKDSCNKCRKKSNACGYFFSNKNFRTCLEFTI